MAEQNEDVMKDRYPMMEALLDQENPDLSSMEATKKKLDELGKNGTDNKEKHAANSGAKAYEAFFNLMGHFEEVKEHLAQELDKAQE